ncbi:MAG: ATP-binding protein [Candidatus Nanoarchaeia archaeon]
MSELPISAPQVRESDDKRDTGNINLENLTIRGVYHDLSGLLQFIGFAHEGLSKYVIPGGKKYLDILETAATRGELILSKLLPMAQKSRGKNIFINNIVNELMPLFSCYDHSIELNLEPKLYQVKGDPIGILQVVLNLCKNASESMPDGGVLSIDTSNAILDNSHYAHLKIQDTGCGMDGETMKNMYDKFFSTKESTGMGMAFVQDLIQRHNGIIQVNSKVGVGTTFDVYLPGMDPYYVSQSL